MKGRLLDLAARAALALWDKFWPEPVERPWADTIESPVPDLDPDATYEECPACHGAADGCMTCWDSGLVIHTHD